VIWPEVPELTVPDPLETGVAHVPSPRQKVVADALVPLFKLVTGRFPVTPVDNGKPVALVRVTEVGIPKIGVTSVGEVERTLFPLPVLVVTPVPPLATASVPASVTAPVVAVLGVSPVVPAEKEETAVGLEAAIVIEPAALVIVTLEPAVSVVRVKPVPLPISNAPFAGVVVRPVPPLAIGNVPVTPVESGSPVAFVRVADVGVPSTGVTNVGLVARTTDPVPALFGQQRPQPIYLSLEPPMSTLTTLGL